MKKEPDPEKLTSESLREAALRYLDRRDASVDQLRQVLRRRAYKYADDEARPAVHERIEAVLSRFVEARLLDDERYARGLAESQRLRGASVLKVRQKLKTRGLADEHIEAALSRFDEDETLGDEAAAQVYARKRRLGQKFDLTDPKEREKALASLARQGFSFDVARRVLGL